MSRVNATITRRSRIKSVEKQYVREAIELIGRSGNLVRNTAVTNIQMGDARSGAIRKDGTRSSGAGEYPKTDTGYLANHINLKIDADKLGASVESNADYSAALEFGTSKMAARPFMHPSLQENKPKIRRLLKQVRAK
tara:strand:+ start:193 stop:603 length:411 start_codon:yes stop_codon:yes gene_type:complete